MDVASPSTLGFVARMISFTFPSISLASSSLILMSSGPTPFIGEIEPCRTWYKPLNSWVLSIAITSFTSSTTQMIVSSLFGLEQMLHGSVSEMLKHFEQNFRLFFALMIASVNSLISYLLWSSM